MLAKASKCAPGILQDASNFVYADGNFVKENMAACGNPAEVNEASDS
jgi:hypothetical protein